MVITRFAPSPTGFLHIGGARTALFNWLFARHCGGKFLLRIEDTDKERSNAQAVAAIYAGLEWLGLQWDGDVVRQSQNATRHQEIAHALLESGAAYRCYASPEDIAVFKETAQKQGKPIFFQSPWRDKAWDGDPNAPYAIRLKAPRDGHTEINDIVQGPVHWANKTLDDMVLLRSDGSPTYMLAVVVDDHDMGITHVIRGDDHLNNTARQSQVYDALGWTRPEFAHIPLIHGPDGKKLSKRHGALGIEAYREMGYPAFALCNALARLGWSHGNEEFFTQSDAVRWFSLERVGRAAARIDFDKLAHLSGRHIAAASDETLIAALSDFLTATGQKDLTEEKKQKLNHALYAFKAKVKTLPALLEQGRFILERRPISRDEKAEKALEKDGRARLMYLTPYLLGANWERYILEEELKTAATNYGDGFGKFAGPLRAALAGRAVAPSVFDMMMVLGREETLNRLSDVCNSKKSQAELAESEKK